MPDPRAKRGGLRAAAAPGRKAEGAISRRVTSRRRAGGNSENYPGVSVVLIPTPISGLSDGSVGRER